MGLSFKSVTHAVSHAVSQATNAVVKVNNQIGPVGRAALAIPTGGLSLAKTPATARKIVVGEAAIAGTVAGGYALYGPSAAETAAASDAGYLSAPASTYGGAVFPTTAANAPELLASQSTEFSGTSLLKTIGSTIKGIAGTITSAKIIADVLGRRKVLPEGAALPAGYTIVGDLGANGELYPHDPASVSSDGIGFKLPQNSGLLLLALAAFAIMKG